MRSCVDKYLRHENDFGRFRAWTNQKYDDADRQYKYAKGEQQDADILTQPLQPTPSGGHFRRQASALELWQLQRDLVDIFHEHVLQLCFVLTLSFTFD